jgi:type 1 glutamine amidotransferase
MTSDLNRRQLLLAGASAWVGMGAANRLLAQPKGESKKVLFFIKSAGFPHSVVTRKGTKPSLAETVLRDIGAEHGFQVVASKDGGVFEPDQIGQWDAFVFETTGDLTTEGGEEKSPPISADGEKAFYDAIRGGKGFIGMHCATDTFGHHGKRKKGAEDPYIQMIGGEFITHGDQQDVRIDIVDPDFPGLATGFGKSGSSFMIKDEWYALKNMPEDLHVILVQVTEGMKGKMYERPNFPITWARPYGKGRVFYTSMGHREEVWTNPSYQGLLLGALGWATGRIEANIEPNVAKVTPGYKELPKVAKELPKSK